MLLILLLLRLLLLMMMMFLSLSPLLLCALRNLCEIFTKKRHGKFTFISIWSLKEFFLCPRCLSSYQQNCWLGGIHLAGAIVKFQFKNHTPCARERFVWTISFFYVLFFVSVQQSRNAISQTDIKIDPHNNTIYYITNWFPILWWLRREREEKMYLQ